MNDIILKGQLRNIQPSHTINGVQYNKAEIVVPRKDGKEDVVNLKFKKFSNIYEEGQCIEILGNVRSFSQQLDNGKNKVEIYVFTYFDKPIDSSFSEEDTNKFKIEGRICKTDELRSTVSGKHNVHFILANNIITPNSSQKLNNYLPCVVWGKLAREFEYNNCSIDDIIYVEGELHSREYQKKISDDEFEIRVAHELVVTDIHKQDIQWKVLNS